MELHEVKNMSFADLKAKRDEVDQALKSIPGDDLAKCFVDALTDAKLRDEKLAEQGKTIILLQEGAEATRQQDSARIERLGQCTAELAETKASLDVALANAKTAEKENARALSALRTKMDAQAATVRENNAEQKRAFVDQAQSQERAFVEEVESLTAQVVRETERANRLKTEASRNHAALSGAAKLLNDALAAQAVENADQGE